MAGLARCSECGASRDRPAPPSAATPADGPDRVDRPVPPRSRWILLTRSAWRGVTVPSSIAPARTRSGWPARGRFDAGRYVSVWLTWDRASLFSRLHASCPRRNAAPVQLRVEPGLLRIGKVQGLEEPLEDLRVEVAFVAGEPGAKRASDVFQAGLHHPGGRDDPRLRQRMRLPDQLLPRRVLRQPGRLPLEQDEPQLAERDRAVR